MRSTLLFIVLAGIISFASAHTRVANVTIAGVIRTDCLRPNGNSDPIMSWDGYREGLMSANYTCGFLPRAGQQAKASCQIAAGQSMNVSYYHGANYGDETPEKDFWIASSHRGPFTVYMARWESNTSVPDGQAWFKIFHSGITQNATGDYKTIKWASPDTLNSNNGAMEFRIPPQLAPGRYLLRTEIIALHDNRERGAQPYVRCVDLTVTGSGTVVPKDLVALPGAIGYNDTGLRFSVYQTRNQNYPIPGPAVFDFTRKDNVPSFPNGTVASISCAGFPNGACPTGASCDLTTGRCKCNAGTRIQGYQCVTSTQTTSTTSTTRSTQTTSTSRGSTSTLASSNDPQSSLSSSSSGSESNEEVSNAVTLAISLSTLVLAYFV